MKKIVLLILTTFALLMLSVHDRAAAMDDKEAPQKSRCVLDEAARQERLLQDYSLTRAQLISQLQKSIDRFKPAELGGLEKAGRLDFIVVNGEKRYHNSSRSNLFFRYPDLKTRRVNPPDESQFERNILNYCRQVRAAGALSPDRHVLPLRLRVEMAMTVNADAVPAGETVRCWLPYPRVYPFQSGMKVISAEPEAKWMGQPEASSRSLYLERTAAAGQPVVFKVQFEYTSWATSNAVNPAAVRPYDQSSPEYQHYTAERAPHVLFTPELTNLAGEIVGAEVNPYLKARRIYDWVAANMVYSYMIEYSLIDNISMYAYQNRYGDCGVQAMLFITLCRIAGVPARWQGCWMFFPEEETIHDWAEFYVEPYGWLPVDPYEGGWVEHEVKTLTAAEKQDLKDFYFGSMTAYRMVANSEFCAPLYPEKEHCRSDMVDFQRGEVEWRGGNLYWDQRSFRWKVEVVE